MATGGARVLFLFTAKDAPSAERPLLYRSDIPFGVSYLIAAARRAGHETRLFVAAGATPLERLDAAVRDLAPHAVCCSAVFSEYRFVARLAAEIRRRHPGIFLLAGGPHVSLNPEASLADAFDGICVGEGEGPLVELLDQLAAGAAPRGIPNLWLKTPAGIERNAPRPFREDLDTLPRPERALWRAWVQHQASFPAVLLGRGCPFLCTYCSNHALRRVAPGRYVRLRSVGDILAEVRELAAAEPGLRQVYLEIETFGVDRAWAAGLCDALAALNAELPAPLAYGVNLRITPGAQLGELFAAMGRANFAFITVGLESGSARVRAEILKRRYGNDDVVRTVALARSHGLGVNFQILIGIPGETAADFRETVAVTRACQPDNYTLSIFFPYPGTELHEEARRRGLLAGELAPEMERARAVLDLPGFPRWRILAEYALFEYRVRRGRRPLPRVLRAVAAAAVRSNPALARLHRALRAAIPGRRGAAPTRDVFSPKA